MKASHGFFLTIILCVFGAFWGYGQGLEALEKGDSLLGAGNYDEALISYKSAAQLLDKDEFRADQIKAFYEMAYIYHITEQYDSALIFYNQVINTPDVNTLRMVASSHNNLSDIHSRENRPMESIESAQEALQVYKAIGVDSLIAAAYYNIGYSYKKIGAFEQAFQYSMEAIKIHEKFDLDFNRDNIYQLVGNILREQKKYPESIDFHNKAINIRKDKRDFKKLAGSYNNLGNTYKMMKEYDRAIEFYNQSLHIRDSIGSSLRSKGKVFSNLGEAYIQTGNFQKARTTLFKSLAAKRSSNELDGMAYVYTQLGELFLDNNELNKSLTYLDSGLVLANKLGIKGVQEENLKLTSDVLFELGRFKAAHIFLENYLVAHDELFNEKSARNSEALRIGYELDKKQRELLQLVKGNEAKQFRIEQQSVINNGLIALILLFIALTIALIYAVFLSRKNTKLQNSLLIDAQHRTKNFLQTLISLFSFQANTIEDPTAKAAVQEGQNRVNAMMIIHHHFSKQNLERTQLDFSLYAKELISQLKHGFQKPGLNTELTLKLDSIFLEAYQTTPLALILNELVSNSFKYSTVNETNLIEISLQRINKGEVHLQVRDNGPGLPENFDSEKLKSSGMKLIRLFVKQLKGTFQFSNQNGLVCDVIVKI